MTSDFREENGPRRMLVQDVGRLLDVQEKHKRVIELLDSVGAEAMLLQDPANIAWFTAGADLFRFAAENCSTSVFITPEARLFATNSVDSSQIFEREVFGLGFQLKQREWFQPHDELVTDLCRGRKVISDRGLNGAKHASTQIREMRLPLTELEVQRMRLLGKVAVHAVEATAHHLRPGVTESEVAGEVSHRLLKRTVAPARIQVCADGRNERYRHWTFGEQPIQDYAVISTTARRWGLHVGVTRTVCLKSVPDNLWKAFQQAVLIHATGLYFSRDGQSLGDVWKKVHRIYEKFGIPHEWQLADQADVIGYGLCETPLTPDSAYPLRAPVPMFWHPSVGPAMVGDSLLCRDGANENLTQSSSWPPLPVRVKGHEVMCPGILLLKNAVAKTDEIEVSSSAASALFDCLEHPREDDPSPVESVWEMKLPRTSAVWEEDDSPYSEESVLE